MPYYIHKFTEDADGVPSDQEFVAEFDDVQDALMLSDEIVGNDPSLILVVSNSQGRVLDRIEA